MPSNTESSRSNADASSGPGKSDKKRRRKRQKETMMKAESDQNSQKKKKTELRRPRPTMFLALQVSNPTIHSKIRTVQETIVESDRNLLQTCVPTAKSHLTLHVFTADENDIDKIKTVMEESVNNTPITLNMEGIGTFGNRVVFAKIDPHPEVSALWQRLKIRIEELGYPMASAKEEFSPHITICKTSKAKDSLIRRGTINPDFYSELAGDSFGQQTCTSLQLLSMTKPTGTDGYYFKLAEVSFAQTSSSESDDHSNCCLKRWSFLNEKKKRVRSSIFDRVRMFFRAGQTSKGPVFLAATACLIAFASFVACRKYSQRLQLN